MCGIAGIFQSSDPGGDAVSAAAMAQAIAYRGPDAQGVMRREDTWFSHRRLAIIDLSEAANQPMTDAADGLMIVFNGEIYNFRELRMELESRGARFRTRGDTEVILELFARDGIDGLARLDGMFALAIYVRRSRELYLMRDRLGKKPLFYFRTGDTVVFASELAALKRHPAWRGELRPEAIHDFLAYEYVPDPDTVYDDVWKLPPGSWARFRTGVEPEIRRYWQPDFRDKLKINFEDAQVELRALLSRAVSRRLIADVPCGIFLSGGMDSGIVAALAARAATEELAAFTIGFDIRRYDERVAARSTVDWIAANNAHGLTHYEQVVDFRSFPVLEQLAAHYGEPFADFSMLPEYFLSRFAATQVKVALSGDGADEIFAGYERYLAMRCFEYLDWTPDFLKQWGVRLLQYFPDGGKRSRIGRSKRLLKVAAAPLERRYFELMAQATEIERRGLYGERMTAAGLSDSARILQRLARSAGSLSKIERCQEVDLGSYLCGDILVKIDRAAMANSLEVRSPFLDTAVVEFAARLPLSFKQSGRSRKHIVKAAFAGLVPPGVLEGRKRGFAVPLGSWFRREWRDLLRERLLEGRLVRDGWMKRDALAVRIEEHASGRNDRTELLGALLMLELFLEQEAPGAGGPEKTA